MVLINFLMDSLLLTTILLTTDDYPHEYLIFD
uniref:Uncharacterized protein n=1 Tax=Schistosoma curassoni TaxID=6186 RepID=A0A183JXT4_9TREM